MALDLNKQVPRSPFDTLEGFPWLPRMIDKARATFAGTHGDYTPYPCPGDKNFLRFVGLDAKALGEVIRSGATDEAIADFVKRNTRRTPEELAEYRRSYHELPRNPLMRMAVRIFAAIVRSRIAKAHPGADLRHLDTLPKLLAFEEGHPIPPKP